MSGKSKFSRRGFLGAAATGAAALALGRHARAQSGGATCSCGTSNVGPKILEVFAYGGMSQWESFWLDSALADPWRSIASSPEHAPQVASFWNEGECQSFLSTLGLNSLPADIFPSGNDAASQTLAFASVNGRSIHWGPATKPLWTLVQGNGLAARMVVMRHELSPHEAAAPYMLTGSILGSPFMAGTGSSITHDLRPTLGGTKPLSYIFSNTANVITAANTGGNSASSRPLVVPRDDVEAFRLQLVRPSGVDALDATAARYADVFRRRLRMNSALSGAPNELVRSNGFAEFEAARVGGLSASPDFLPAAGGFGDTASTACPVTDPSGTDAVASSVESTWRGRLALDRRNLRMATDLLRTHARHCLVQVGTIHGTFDLHGNVPSLMDPVGVTMAHGTMGAVFNVFATLRALYDDHKLCPDCTLVVVSTEFNRKPLPELNYANRGRGHFPMGMVTLLLGGTGTNAPGRTIQGDIDASGTAYAYGGASPVNPADLRAALLLYAGGQPFGDNPRRFTSSNLSAGTNALVGSTYDLASAVRTRVFGS